MGLAMYPGGILLEKAIEAAKAAGAFQLSEFRTRPAGWGTAKAARDFVSHVDVESERLIKDALSEALPGAGFFGEETGRTDGDGNLWIVDPLDGTTNFLSGFDYFCVSIALYREGRPVLGVVYRPVTGELFSGIRGNGTFRNGTRIERQPRLALSDALVATGTPYRSPDLAPYFWKAADSVMKASRDLRRPGSAALDLSYLSAGFFQGFFETDLKPYDVAAALVFLGEAGIDVTDFKGKPYDLFSSRALAAGFGGAHGELIDILGKMYP